MGCDIHMVVEKRMRLGGSEKVGWVGVNSFPYVNATIYKFRGEQDGPSSMQGRVAWQALQRNYDLFASLAGVRGEGPEARGVPDDASCLALHEIEAWGEDGHSHTWMTLDEALPLFIKSGQFGEPDKAVVNALREGMAVALAQYAGHFWNLDETDNLADFRLVMWFDN